MNDSLICDLAAVIAGPLFCDPDKISVTVTHFKTESCSIQ